MTKMRFFFESIVLGEGIACLGRGGRDRVLGERIGVGRVFVG